MITFEDLQKRLTQAGYKVTVRALKYWVQEGLMPEPTGKKGGYREGVRLVFEDAKDAEATALKIFEFKGRGFTLAEIKKVFEENASDKAFEKHKRYLKQFVEIDGRVYQQIAPDVANLGVYERLSASLVESGRNQFDLSLCGGIKRIKSDAKKIEELGLCSPLYLIGNERLYDFDDLYGPSAWIKLRREYDIEWETLKLLHTKHSENVERLWFWPSPDGAWFTDAYIKWNKQGKQDCLGSYLLAYYEWMKRGFRFNAAEHIYFGMPIWCYKYATTHQLIEDFIRERCAFVSGVDEFDQACIFLKKFEKGENYK